MALSPEEWADSVRRDGRSPEAWLGLLVSSDPDERHRAKVKLGGLTPGDRHFLPALVAAAGSPHDLTRMFAVLGLGRIGQATPDVIAAIRTALADPVPSVRQSALMVLPDVAVIDGDVAAAVVRLLRSDPETHVRSDAARAAGSLAARRLATVPALIEATYDAEPVVRRRATIALKLLGSLAAEAAPRLWQLSTDGEADGTAAQATAALRAMGLILG